MPKPTTAQVKAVRAVLYQPQRVKDLARLQANLAVVMNLNPDANLGDGDVCNPPGSGPQWYIPATGAIDDNITLAAGFCDQIAAILLKMRADLAKLDIPAVDRTNLRTALAEEAASWSARGRVWKRPGQPADPRVEVAEISNHFSAALAAAKRVAHYYRPPR
jgi:hypothetical protein